MGAKRALIVDDSKSARVFLARALEKYDIDVDAADSAEAAIAYLSSNRPDVIFMDHLMPGMDGLQAVQAIKNNPRTATIPIMMYTSQEGELYLGQARALGAVGVLPKQIKPTDVSKVLFELHLVPERRTVEQTSFTPLNPRVVGSVSCAGISSLRTNLSGSSQLISNSIGTRLFPRIWRVRPVAMKVRTADSFFSPPSASRADEMTWAASGV